MEYFQEVLNRKTGALETVSIGEWITISEFGNLMGIGPRQVRSILIDMNFLYIAQGEQRSRTRICPWVEERGWGHSVRPRKGYPFDVISEDAQRWILQRWPDAKLRSEALPVEAKKAKAALHDFIARRIRPEDMNATGQIKWLADHFPALTHTEISKIVSVSQQLVSRKLGEFEEQLKLALERKASVGGSSVTKTANSKAA